MEAQIRNAKEFTSLLTTLSLFDATFNVECSTEGLYIFCLAGTKTSIATVRLSPNYFESYQYRSDVPVIQLGISTSIILQILRGTSSSDQVSLSVGDCASPDNVVVGIQRSDRHLSYTVKLLHITNEEKLEIPPMEPNVSIEVRSDMLKAFKKEITDCTGASVVFTPTQTSMIVNSTGDNGSVKVTVPEGDKLRIILFANPLPMSLGSNTMNVISQLANLATNVTLGWTNGTPAHFNVPLGDFDAGKLDIWFAPLLEDEVGTN